MLNVLNSEIFKNASDSLNYSHQLQTVLGYIVDSRIHKEFGIGWLHG